MQRCCKNNDMDSKDFEILRCLRSDSRVSMGLIAEQLGISKATVSRRLSRMEKDGVITGYSVEVNPSKLNLMRALLSIEVIGSSVHNVIEELKRFPEVANIYKSFGDHNIVVELFTSSVDSLYELIQERFLVIANIYNVEVDILVERIDVDPNSDIKIYQRDNR